MAVVRGVEVGGVLLSESLGSACTGHTVRQQAKKKKIYSYKAIHTNGVLVVVLKDAARGKEGVVDVLLLADIGNHEGSDHVCADGFGLVVLAPVHVRAPSDSSSVQHMGSPEGINFSNDAGSVVGSALYVLKGLALLGKKLSKLTTDPASASKNKVLMISHY